MGICNKRKPVPVREGCVCVGLFTSLKLEILSPHKASKNDFFFKECASNSMFKLNTDHKNVNFLCRFFYLVLV